MILSPQGTCPRTPYRALDTPNPAESSASVMWWTLGDRVRWGLSYHLHYSVSCTPACAVRTSWAVLVNIQAMSCFQAVKRDLLVAYPVIYICEKIYITIQIWNVSRQSRHWIEITARGSKAQYHILQDIFVIVVMVCSKTDRCTDGSVNWVSLFCLAKLSEFYENNLIVSW